MKTVLCILLLTSSLANAVGTSSAEKPQSNRLANKTGITTGIGNPFPSIFGVNVSYNVLDYLRASIGFGEISVSGIDSSASVKTTGIGADVMVPGWNLSPTAGLHISKVDVSASGGGSLSIQGIEESTTLVYAQGGLDWQAQGGFNLGLGQTVGLSGGDASGSYFNIGWFF
jgi:hypothetical protein